MKEVIYLVISIPLFLLVVLLVAGLITPVTSGLIGYGVNTGLLMRVGIGVLVYLVVVLPALGLLGVLLRITKYFDDRLERDWSSNTEHKEA